MTSNLINSAKAYAKNSRTEREREVVMRYYFQEPYGDETVDRSSIVTGEVMETVNWLLPPVKKKFLWSNRPVEFSASYDLEETGDDPMRRLLGDKITQEEADDASEYVAHVFYDENEGFKVICDVFWDAFVSKTGIMQHYYTSEWRQSSRRFFNLTEDQVDALVSEDREDDVDVKYEVDDRRDVDDGMGGTVEVVDITVTVTKEVFGTKVKSVPPEDFFVLAGDIYVHEDMQGCFHRIKKPRYQWLDDGYDWDSVMNMPSDTVETEELQITRQGRSTTAVSNVDPMQQEVTGWQCYVNIDKDGDGVTELYKIMLGGEGGDFLLNATPQDGGRSRKPTLSPFKRGGKLAIEQVNEIPYTDFCAWRIPHTFYGECPGDRVADLQLLSSQNTRQRQDYSYEVNMPTLIVGEAGERINEGGESVTLTDAMDRSPGDVIRAGDASQVAWNRPPDISPLYIQIEQWIDKKRMERTGSMPIAPATDPDSLNPNSATEVQDRRSSHDEIIDDIAGSFANSLARVFKQILAVEIRYAKKPKTLMIGDKRRKIDPRLLPNVMGVTVNVGQGSGISEKSVAALMATQQTQAQLVQQFGWADDNPAQGFVYRTQFYQTCADLARASGMDSPHKYYTDPTGKNPYPVPPGMYEQMLQQATQEAQQSVLIQLQKYQTDTDAKVDMAKIRADLEKSMAQTQQRDAASRRETAQKDADSRRDADVTLYEVNTKEATKRQEIAADMAVGRTVNISG